jgi:hypothetical protein
MVLEDPRFAELADKIALSFAVTMYFRSPLYAIREPLIACYDDYLARAEKELRWYGDSKINRIRKATPDLLRLPAEQLHLELPPNSDFLWHAHGGKAKDSAGSYSMNGASRSRAHELSLLRCAFPLEHFVAKWADALDLTLKWARTVPVFHGYAGLSFSESEMDYQVYRPLVKVGAFRYLGLEVEQLSVTSFVTADAIKSVNWLTFLSNTFVERLGGFDVLRRRLSSEIGIHAVLNGVVIQAGPEPGAGDVNAGETLPLYREVARALKPIRTTKQLLARFSEEENAGWLARFD